MQHRMRTHQLDRQQIDRLLDKAEVASLATVNGDGTPYVTPVHFLYQEGAVYVHGLPAGQKVDNIKANPAVSLAVYKMEGLLTDPAGNPCDTNTSYQSVIIQGTASLLTDVGAKKAVLEELVKKYTPALSGRALPENMVKGTAVLKIQADATTGKYYGATKVFQEANEYEHL